MLPFAGSRRMATTFPISLASTPRAQAAICSITKLSFRLDTTNIGRRSSGPMSRQPEMPASISRSGVVTTSYLGDTLGPQPGCNARRLSHFGDLQRIEWATLSTPVPCGLDVARSEEPKRGRSRKRSERHDVHGGRTSLRHDLRFIRLFKTSLLGQHSHCKSAAWQSIQLAPGLWVMSGTSTSIMASGRQVLSTSRQPWSL